MLTRGRPSSKTQRCYTRGWMKTEVLGGLRKAVDEGAPWPKAALTALSAEERTLCVVALAALSPERAPTDGELLELLDARACRSLRADLSELWARRLAEVGRRDLLLLLGAQGRVPARALWRVAVQMYADGHSEPALRLVRSLSVIDKLERALALIEIAKLSDAAALVDEAIDALMTSEPITMGTGQGGDELAYAVRLFEALTWLPASHPAIAKLVGHAVRLGKRGQKQLEPSHSDRLA